MAQAEIPEKYLDLFEKRSFAHLATLMPDGSPQVTPVWIGYDGTHLLVNSEEGRQKVRNMERDPRVAVSIQDPDDPYRYLQVRGRVVEITTGGADEHIDSLAHHYLGKETYPDHKTDKDRIIFRIKPEHV